MAKKAPEPVAGVDLFNAAASAYAAVKDAEAARQEAAEEHVSAMAAADKAFATAKTDADAKLKAAVDAHQSALAALGKIQSQLAAIVGTVSNPDAWRFRQSS